MHWLSDALTPFPVYVGVFVGVWPTQYVCAPLVCWCLQRPEEDIGPPGTWMAVSCHVGPGTGIQVLPKRATAPNCWATLLFCLGVFLSLFFKKVSLVALAVLGLIL